MLFGRWNWPHQVWKRYDAVLIDASAAAGSPPEMLRELGSAMGRLLTEGAFCAILGSPASEELNDLPRTDRGALGDTLQGRGVGANRILVVGTTVRELLRLPELAAAAFVTIAARPDGLANGVFHLPGGSERLIALLNLQVEMRRRKRDLFPELIDPASDPAFLVEQDGFDPSREREMEAIYSLSNGYLGIRGSTALTIPSSLADLYVAGVYDRKAEALPYSEIEFMASSGRDDLHAELVALPSPLRAALRRGGKQLFPGEKRLSEHERILDLRNGRAHEVFRYRESATQSALLRFSRCVGQVNRHLLVEDIEIVAERPWPALRFELDPFPPVSDFQLTYPHIERIEERTERDGTRLDVYRTGSSKVQLAVASRILAPDGRPVETPLRLNLSGYDCLGFRRVCSVYTSRESTQPREDALAALKDVDWATIDAHFRHETERWQRRWSDASVVFEDRPEITQAFSFCEAQLFSNAPAEVHASVGARGLTGRAYEGHIFWDAEAFILPFYLQHDLEAAKKVLLYRYGTLAGARRRAEKMGARGACFAWESSVTGDDVTPRSITITHAKTAVPVFTGEQQIHVTAAVALGVLRYWEASRDDEFLIGQGAEILFETARFWRSRATAERGRLHLRQVIGPDEYHSHVNDNFYTNWMARMNLERASWCAEWMAQRYPGRLQELCERLRLSNDEISAWSAGARMLHVPEPGPDGVIEQFEGFFKLRRIRLRSGERLHAPIERLLNWREVNGTQIVKQADVLMLPFLFPGALPLEILRKNYAYYEPITDHGSSLSPAVHAAIAARIGEPDHAERYWAQSLKLDLENTMGNTALGLHLACMGAAWQAFRHHFIETGIPERLGRVRVGVQRDSLQWRRLSA